MVVRKVESRETMSLPPLHSPARTASPGRTLSPTGRPKSPTSKSPSRRDATRYGQIKEPDLKFGSEQRFKWQQTSSNDVSYDLPPMTMSRSVAFGYSLRKGMDEENPDNKKRSTGPGSYEFSGCFDHLSEYAHKEANRFACAPRQSMAVKTPSPGAVYNIEKKYYLGPEKSMGIGFANASRAPLYGKSASANADMFIPKPETGSAITIAGRPKPAKFLQTPTPGAIYDVHVRLPSLNIGRHLLLM